MITRLHRYILLALLLIVPLQGMAGVLHAITCASHAAPAAAVEHDDHSQLHAAADTAAHDHGGAHPHSHDSKGGSGDSAQHQCCHHLSAAPAAYVAPHRADLPVYQSSATVLELTFVLEQPQRPPRA